MVEIKELIWAYYWKYKGEGMRNVGKISSRREAGEFLIKYYKYGVLFKPEIGIWFKERLLIKTSDFEWGKDFGQDM